MKQVSNKWQVVTDDGYAIADTDAENTQLTHGGCGCCSSYGEVIDDEHVARLMAAAPELLRKLREIDKWGQDTIDTSGLLERFKDIEFKED